MPSPPQSSSKPATKAQPCSTAGTPLTFAALAAGVRAVVWGTASIRPGQCVALHRLLIDEIDLPAARDLWTRLWPLCTFLEGHSYAAAVKAACALVGDTTGPTRAPLLPLTDDARTQLQRLLNRARAASRERATVTPWRNRPGYPLLHHMELRTLASAGRMEQRAAGFACAPPTKHCTPPALRSRSALWSSTPGTC
jgi:hypothetical protein